MSTAPAQASSSGTPTENLAGLVERVTFHNEENGFCVLRLKARGQRDLVTVIGHAAMISAGEWVQAAGAWTNDRTHGLQFRANFLKATPPTTIEGIERYLGSGMIRGIGPAYAKRLVKTFGEAVFDVIEVDPSRLREVELPRAHVKPSPSVSTASLPWRPDAPNGSVGCSAVSGSPSAAVPDPASPSAWPCR